MTASAPGEHPSRLLFVHDRSTGLRFLIDTGAEISVIPRAARYRHLQPSAISLQAANGSRIPTYGRRSLTLDLGLRRQFPWIFTIADVHTAIIGVDLLSAFGLVVDVKQQNILDTSTSLSVNAQYSKIYSIGIRVQEPEPSVFSDVLRRFPELTQSSNLPASVPHEVNHTIITKGQPVTSKPRRLTPEKLAMARSEFQHMLQLGIIRLSIWSRRKLLETGVPAVITVPSTIAPFPIDTLSHTSMTSPSPFTQKRFFQKSTLFVRTTTYPWLNLTFPK